MNDGIKKFQLDLDELEQAAGGITKGYGGAAGILYINKKGRK